MNPSTLGASAEKKKGGVSFNTTAVAPKYSREKDGTQRGRVRRSVRDRDAGAAGSQPAG